MGTEYGSGWNIKDLLADLMGTTAELEPEPRAEIWASDMGKPYVDRWLQMKGVPYSNPPTGKELVTFFLGKQIERGIEELLTRCGLAYRRQEKVTLHRRDCLPVVGRPDLLLEVRDWEAVLAAVEEEVSEDPDDHPGGQAQGQALAQLLSTWKERCPQGLTPTVFEVKSLNSAAFKYHRGGSRASGERPRGSPHN